MLRGGSDVPGRYAVDYASGIAVTVDAEGSLDAALRVKGLAPKRAGTAQRVRLLGPKEGTPPEVIDPDEDEDEKNEKEEEKK
jgi:hypothetical protein